MRWKMICQILRQDRSYDCNIAIGWSPERDKMKRKAQQDVENEKRKRKTNRQSGAIERFKDDNSRPRKVEELWKRAMCNEARGG